MEDGRVSILRTDDSEDLANAAQALETRGIPFRIKTEKLG